VKNKRREFIKLAGLTGIGVAGNFYRGFANDLAQIPSFKKSDIVSDQLMYIGDTNLIGAYGPWAAGLTANKLPSLSWRRQEYTELDSWRKMARQRLTDRLAIPEMGAAPNVTVKKQYIFDGLHVEELSWQLSYGPPTDAVVLKPEGASGRLPAILAFHDHGGNKYFGTRKIIKTSGAIHPMMVDHQRTYYEGRAWANEIAKRGYLVLVPDAFPFASRRVLLQDVPEHLRNGLNDNDPENAANIEAYNKWAGDHENIMAKSLFCAGTTWPGVFFGEDRVALDILCARPDVDPARIGCGGLSGGGMRTVFMAGQDDRIKCAVPVGFMTTWKDFLLNKAFMHTWMVYVPLSPNEMDFPEILGMRAPLPTLVLNDEGDELYTLAEMKNADRILRDVYDKAGAGEQYHCSYYPGPHKFDKAMQTEAFAWFDRWLKAS